jgi:hypothetical protein
MKSKEYVVSVQKYVTSKIGEKVYQHMVTVDAQVTATSVTIAMKTVCAFSLTREGNSALPMTHAKKAICAATLSQPKHSESAKRLYQWMKESWCSLNIMISQSGRKIWRNYAELEWLIGQLVGALLN